MLQLENESTWFQLTLIAPDLAELNAEKFQEKTLWQWKNDEKLIAVEWVKENGEKVILQPHFTPKQLQTLQFLQAKQWLKTPIDFHVIPREPQRIIFTTQNTFQEKHSYELHIWERLNGDFQSGRYDNQNFVLTQAWIDILFQITHKPYWDKLSSIWNSEDL